MKNLVIVGNGFDLAHGLKTKYADFIDYLKINSNYFEIKEIRSLDNRLLIALFKRKKELWSDIECAYYEILRNLDNKKYLQDNLGAQHMHIDVKELNKQFEEIKNWLCEYLEKEENEFKPNKNYEQFFNALSKKDTVILNFNYTNTVKKYIETHNLDIDVIHIHGELDNPDNPIIFGFAASNEESKELLIQNDNNYVRNIKKFNYLYTTNEDRLKEYLYSQEFNLFILGHSCGVSDRLILSQILNSPGIIKIYPFYFRDSMGYFETMVNIDRIIDDYSKTNLKSLSFNKLVSYPNAYPMPQTVKDENLSAYLNKILTAKFPSELQMMVINTITL